MRAGIIICSRSNSSRIPNKPFQLVKDKMLIQHLIEQLIPLKIPICIAIPPRDDGPYKEFLKGYKDLLFYSGEEDSPLHRTQKAAQLFKFDTIIRITHDKIFIDRECFRKALNIFSQLSTNVNYIYSSHLVDGSGFEIFTYEILSKAAQVFDYQDIEHISYAIKSVAPKSLNYEPIGHYNKAFPDIRFLIDFEEDLEFIRSVYGYSITGSPDLKEALETVERFPFLKKINKQPEITLYTCAHNEEEFIQWAIESVVSQTLFPSLEFIIIDDASTDNTYKKVLSSKFFSNRAIKIRRNEKNLGLSSSSNVALGMARGKYIMRLDADDALLFPFTLEKMLQKAKQGDFEALYPNYVDHKTGTIKHGKDTHHVGGCLFLTKTIRNIQFTEKLRGWEGLDLFERAKGQMKIGYYEDLPAFFYRDRPGSMSQNNMEYREVIKQHIANGKLGYKLCDNSMGFG